MCGSVFVFESEYARLCASASEEEWFCQLYSSCTLSPQDLMEDAIDGALPLKEYPTVYVSEMEEFFASYMKFVVTQPLIYIFSLFFPLQWWRR